MISARKAFHLRCVKGNSFKNQRHALDLDEFCEELEKKTLGLIMPSFYLLDPVQLPADTKQRMPQNGARKFEGSHLRFFGLLDVDMETGAEKLDPNRVHSLASARETNAAFDEVMQKAEDFAERTPHMRAWFTGGKGVRMCEIPPAGTNLDVLLFVKLANDGQYKTAMMERYQAIYPAFSTTIKPNTDESILVHGQGIRTDLFPKEGGDFAPKLLELNANGKFMDVAFDKAEDTQLSQLIVSLWISVAKQVDVIQHPFTAYLDSAPCMQTDMEIRKSRRKQGGNGKKKRASTTRPRSASGKGRRRNKSNSNSNSNLEGAKKQKTHDAATSHAALFAYLKTQHPSISNAVFEFADEVYTEDAVTMKFVNRDSGHCPMKEGEHRNTRNVALYVENYGSYNFTCFHPDCDKPVTGHLPNQLVAELFNETARPEPLDFDTDFAGAKLFQERVLRGRAVCTKANGDGAYIFDEKTCLWKKDDKAMIRHLIASEFPAFIESESAHEDLIEQFKKARKYEDVGAANSCLTMLLPLITDVAFPARLDQCEYMLSVQNRALNLQDLTVRPRTIDDLMTNCIATPWPEQGADYETPLIDSYVKQFLGIKDPGCEREEDREKGHDDPEDQYGLALLGYVCLTGSYDVHILTFIYGSTAGNAKTATVELLYQLMGDYAVKLQHSVLLPKKSADGDGADPALMSMKGKRMGYAEEFSGEKSFDDCRLKDLTGGGSLSSRQIYEGQVTFKQTCKLMLASNNKPVFDNHDDAIKRRLVLLKADTEYRNNSTKVKYDPTNPKHRWGVANKVKSLNTEEARMQLLVWLAHGAKAFYDANCTLPPILKSLSDFADDVHAENDLVGSFVREMCNIDPAFNVSKIGEYVDYQTGPDLRYLYLAENLKADFENYADKEFTPTHKRNLMRQHGVGIRRLRK
jgi:phage/plasmid-associated DNA primase